WGVGPWGTLVHYDGSKWTKLDFDTQGHFMGVTGDKETGTAYAVLSRFHSYYTDIIKLDGSGWEEVLDGDTAGVNSYTVEKGPGDDLYLGGSGRIWTFNIKTKKIQNKWPLPDWQSVLTQSIYSDKDMYFFGDDLNNGKMSHYNGKRLTTFTLSKNPVNYGGSHAINNLAVYAGYADNKAFIIFIKRR
ncbi:MAG TPA: hypothetical protein VHP30_09190, partial [Ignavibacteriales bacterium]|nr:hypothetical protein [Ignavibacteriales bacterium]